MESTWLKSVFQETEPGSASDDCPPSKRIKFSEVSAELHTHFPEKKYSPYEVSRLVTDAFPHTESKACGKSRQKQLLGLERILTASASRVTVRRSSEPATVRRSSEPATHTPSISDLLVENQLLKARVQELERTSASALCHQADEILHHKSAVTEGANSLESFYALNLDVIVGELQSRAPDLYNLYMMLGDAKRNQQKEEVTTEEVKAVTSMCSMLNARSARMKGLQLLISMMLVARATSRQVHIIILFRTVQPL